MYCAVLSPWLDLKEAAEGGGDLAFPFVCSLPALSILRVAGEFLVQSI